MGNKTVPKDVCSKVRSGVYEKSRVVFSSGDLFCSGEMWIEDGTGRAVCRQCGQKILRGEKQITFFYDFSHKVLSLTNVSEFSQRVCIHMITCTSGDPVRPPVTPEGWVGTDPVPTNGEPFGTPINVGDKVVLSILQNRYPGIIEYLSGGNLRIKSAMYSEVEASGSQGRQFIRVV